MTKDLQKQIEELKNYIKYKPDQSLGDSLAARAFDSGVDSGIEQIKKALLIINQLQEDRDRYKHLWESNSIEAKEIMAEMEDHINKLREEKKQFRQIGLDWIEIANKQKEEIKQLKEKLNDK